MLLPERTDEPRLVLPQLQGGGAQCLRVLRSWEVRGRDRQSTEQIRRLFARYRELARDANPVVGDTLAEGELAEPRHGVGPPSRVRPAGCAGR